MNLLMISGDSSIAAGRRGVFYRTLERFARAWSRIDVIVPRPSAVVSTDLLDNVFVHPSTRPKALLWRHILERGLMLHRQREYALMVSHDHGWHQNGLGAWLLHRATGTPYVSELHGFSGHPRSATWKARAQGYATRLYVRVVKGHVAAFRVVNACDLPKVLTGLGVTAEKILVLYALYVDHDVFTPAMAAKQYDVMFCGRAEPNKGGALLIEAFAAVARTRPDATLLMLTAGPAETDWRRLAERLGIASHVTWAGWVDSTRELAALYCASRMLVCTSFSEGGPRVTAEAMACGTPVISTPVGLMPELIDHGRTGLLVDWRPSSVTNAIERMLNDPERASAMGRAGRACVARFDRSTTIDACASAYLALAQRTPPASHPSEGR